MNKKYTYIDISGIGNSGKTALSDMLREVDGIHVHEGFFEFNLIRFPDGIFDLKWAICDNLSNKDLNLSKDSKSYVHGILAIFLGSY